MYSVLDQWKNFTLLFTCYNFELNLIKQFVKSNITKIPKFFFIRKIQDIKILFKTSHDFLKKKSSNRI